MTQMTIAEIRRNVISNLIATCESYGSHVLESGAFKEAIDTVRTYDRELLLGVAKFNYDIASKIASQAGIAGETLSSKIRERSVSVPALSVGTRIDVEDLSYYNKEEDENILEQNLLENAIRANEDARPVNWGLT